MSWNVLCSDITIGKFRFAGAHEVRVRRSLHTFAESAVIVLPSISKVIRGKSASEEVFTTSTRFAENDPVIINIGYNDSYLNYSGTPLTMANSLTSGLGATPVIPGNNTGLGTVFQGFVKRIGHGMPLEVECEGYVRRLRQDVDVTIRPKNTSAKELLNLITKAVPAIKVVVVDDLPLVGVGLNHVNGVEIIEAVKRFSEGILNVFFINPTTIWCGLTYTPYSQSRDPFNLGEVNYRLGYNVIKDNSLKERVPEERVQILFGGTLATGQKVMAPSDDKTAKNKQKTILNHVGDVATMRIMANEKQYMMNYAGYEGGISAFLQPYCAPGWIANIKDARYPALDGKYLVEGTDITYGMQGARIKVQIGPQLGFKTT